MRYFAKAARFCAIAAATIIFDAACARAGEIEVAHGKALVETNCARCHSVGLDGASPNAKAPPFRLIYTRIPVETIAATLLTKATPDHSEMPKFTISPQQAADIAAYIASIQPENLGQKLVEINCGPCHATGRSGESPHSQAPVFRQLGRRYPLEQLEESLAEGLTTGHPDMPTFVAEPHQIADIIAYLKSIQE